MSNIDLISLDVIPQKYRNVFKEYKTFNAMQSKCFPDTFNSDKSIVVGAPTSSGKTVIFELAIIRLLIKTEKRNLEIGHFKCVYVAPIKALCSERYHDWNEKFSSIGITVKEVTGDNEIGDISELQDVHLILTTPEKWDVLTRKWRDNKEFVDGIKLFMIDEIHLLNEPKRGPTLEAIISRMKIIHDVKRIFNGEDITVENKENLFRFIAVSATIPNIDDLATWLGHGYPDSIKYFAISDEMRPIKLKKIVLGYERHKDKGYFKFDLNLNYQLTNVINKYADNKPTLIFCTTRRGVELAANVLIENLLIQLSPSQENAIHEISSQLSDLKLRNALSKGIAFHHAGLTVHDRHIIENGFRRGEIPVLLCTSSLAMGINLPAHLVIIKSTSTNFSGIVEDISENTLMQMIGRAGRPQFDVSGVAVIMTQQDKKFSYKWMRIFSILQY
uniref:CSON008546 protein n=1 Tax=Culicoides sonorensis TaxID=179676 RepID=A0A336N1Z5_CULSO